MLKKGERCYGVCFTGKERPANRLFGIARLYVHDQHDVAALEP